MHSSPFFTEHTTASKTKNCATVSKNIRESRLTPIPIPSFAAALRHGSDAESALVSSLSAVLGRQSRKYISRASSWVAATSCSAVRIIRSAFLSCCPALPHAFPISPLRSLTSYLSSLISSSQCTNPASWSKCSTRLVSCTLSSHKRAQPRPKLDLIPRKRWPHGDRSCLKLSSSPRLSA